MAILSSVLGCRLDFSAEDICRICGARTSCHACQPHLAPVDHQAMYAESPERFQAIQRLYPIFQCDVHVAAIASIEFIRPQRDHVSRKARETFVGVIEHELVAYEPSEIQII
jgi:hypothetical protein